MTKTECARVVVIEARRRRTEGITLREMRRSRAVATVALTMAIVWPLAVPTSGAGTPLTKGAYEKRMQAVGQAYLREKAAVVTVAGSNNLPRLALQNQQLATVYGRLAARLVALDPPNDVAADHRILIVAFHSMAKWFSAAHAAAARGDKLDAFRLSARSLTDPVVRRAREAETDMKAKGYKLGIFTQYV